MADGRQDLLAHYRRMQDQVEAAIEGLTDEEMSEPSLDGWSVKDHLLHLALWHELRAQEVTRISAGQESAWKMTEEQDADLNALGLALRGSLPAAQARWELEEARRKLLEAIAAATPRGLDPSLYGEAGLVSTHEAEHAEWIRSWRDR
jgi:uncharacterized damage-inducible protein DinB